MYQHPQQMINGPIIQPARYPTNPTIVTQQPVYQGYMQPPIINNQKLAQQGGYPQQTIVGHYSVPNEMVNPSVQQRTTNSQIHAQSKGINYVQQQPQQQSFNTKPAPLIQPPSLNSNMDQHHPQSQFFQQRAPMTQSNNDEYDNFHQQEEEQMWTNEAQIASMFWEQRCMTMLQRFEWFYERFQILRNQYSTLSQEMQKMDSEEEWHRFQTHHDEFHQKIQEMEQELSAVLGENQQLVQQKQTQQNENVWEQRYQELLGNFKSLQEEMAHMEGGSGGKTGEVPHEQYQQLEEHCNQLQYQYGQVLDQLQKYRQTEEPDTSHLQEQIHHYMQELEQNKNKLNTLHNENQELQNMYAEVEEQNQRLKQERTKSIGVDKKKYQDLVKQVQLKEEQIKKLQEEFKAKGTLMENLNQAEATLAQKNRELEQIRRDFQQKNREAEQRSREVQQRSREAEQRKREIDEKNKEFDQKNREVDQRNRQIEDLKRQLKDKEGQMTVQINQSRIQLMGVEESVRIKIKEEHQAEKRSRDKKIGQLQRHVEQLHTDVRRNSQHSFKAQNLQKKLNYVNQQNSNLTQTLKKKNQQLVELRSLAYELEKLKEIQVEYYKIVEQRDSLRESIKKKNQQIQNLHQENDKLSLKIQEVTNKRIQYNIRNLTAEIEDLNEQLSKKQGEINKLKSLSEVKEEYLQKMEEEYRQAKSKIIILEQSLENEREFNREKEIQTSSKSNDYDKRIKNLDYEFNIQLKDTLEKEVTVLRKQNVQKHEQIRRLEENEMLLTSKLAIFEKQKDNFDQDVAFLKKKEKELQLLNEDQSRKYKELERTCKAKDLDLEGLKQSETALNTYINNLKLQIEQHNNLIKSKNRTIEDLQTNISTRLLKCEQADKLNGQNNKLKATLNSAYQQIQNLKFNDQQLSRSKALSTSNLHSSKREFQRQESIVISNLHQQNQQLKQEIAKLLQKFTDTSFFPQKDSGKKVTANLNKRLTEFNSKLQYAISSNDSVGLQESQSQKVLLLWEKERRELINTYESELKSLKEQLTQVKIANSRISERSLSQSSKKHFYQNGQGDKQKDESYRQKFREQQQRNTMLVKVNEELKSKIDSILKIKQSNSTLEYYKEQCQKTEGQNDNLKQKVKALSLENKQYKIQLGAKNAKLTQEFQFKIMELEMVIQQSQRKIAYLQTEKASADNQKASLIHDLNIVNLDKSVSKVKSVSKKEESILFQSRYPESPKYSSKYGGVEQQFSSVLGNIPSASYVPSYNYNFYDNQISSKKYLDKYSGGYAWNKAGRV